MFKRFMERPYYIAGFGISLFFGLGIIVNAVAPGVVTNPTFSPNEDDVLVKFVSGPVVVAAGTDGPARADNYRPGYPVANCPAGYKVVGGGCHATQSYCCGEVSWIIQCAKNNAKSDLSGWECECYFESESGSTQHTAEMRADAVCVKSP